MKGRSYVRLAGIAGPVPTLVPVHSPSSFRGRRGGVPAITNAFGQPLDTPKSLPKFFAAKRLSGLSADAAVSGVLLVSMLLNGGYGYEPQP